MSCNIFWSFVVNSYTLILRASNEHNMDLESIHTIFKKNKSYLFEIRLVLSELNGEDFDHQVEFYDITMARTYANLDFLYRIVFQNEATFHINDTLNRHNSRYYYHMNPYWMREDKTQYSKKFDVWDGLLNEKFNHSLSKMT